MRRHAAALIAWGLLAGAGLSSSSTALAADVKIPNRSVGNAPPKFFLLSIGVSRYQNEFWPDLRWPREDATAVAKVFGADTGYDREVITLYDEAASKEAIAAALAKIRSAARPRDVVAVYVSAHGTLAIGASAALLPVIALSGSDPRRLQDTGLSQAVFTDWLVDVRAKKKLLIFATCHSGLGKSKLAPEVQEMLSGAKGRIANLEDVSEGSLVLAASARGETAREDNRLGGDIYTRYLLEALTVYDRNGDGKVTALEAHDYAKEKTYRYTKGQQRPTAQAEFIGEADVVIFGRAKKPPGPVLEAYDQQFQGFELQVGNGPKGRLPLAFPLDKGANLVRIYPEGASRPLASYNVSASGGETIALQDVMALPPFSVAIGVATLQWQDARVAKISGEELSNHYHLTAGYQYGNLQAYASYALPTKHQGEIWSQVDAEFSYQYYQLGMRYTYPLLRMLNVGGGLLVGRDVATLTLADEVTDAKLKKQSAGFIYGAGLAVEFMPMQSLSVQHELGYQVGTFDFGDWGALAGDRFFLSVGLGFKFGAKARRL